MTVSAGTKTFENLKRRNYKCCINESCSISAILTPFIYQKLRLWIKNRHWAHPKDAMNL